MAFSINQFQGEMRYGGARPALFEVTLSNPVNNVADIKTPFMIKAAQIPGATLTAVPVKYFGRDVKFAGNRVFEDWTVTILNDEDFAVRHAMEQWSNAINTFEGNLRAFPTGAAALYKADAQVTQFAKTGFPVRTYNMVGVFPTAISAIDLNWEQGDQIEEYQVTFSIDYWQVIAGTTGILV